DPHVDDPCLSARHGVDDPRADGVDREALSAEGDRVAAARSPTAARPRPGLPEDRALYALGRGYRRRSPRPFPRPDPPAARRLPGAVPARLPRVLSAAIRSDARRADPAARNRVARYRGAQSPQVTRSAAGARH